LIDHGHSGLLATPGDARALADQLRQVIEDAPLRQRLAVAGRAKVERAFHLADNVARLADIFRSLPAVTVQRGAS
jgi:colanic acid/amylovoran biosynthesis glycosyltransferase